MLPTDPQQIQRRLAENGLPADRLLIAGSSYPSLSESAGVWIGNYQSIMKFEVEEKLELGFAIEPAADDVAALSRMRDLLCRRVLLSTSQWQPNDLRALGFIALEDNEAMFIYDPDLIEQPREWNNASNWANPENFSRFRW